MQGFFPHFRCSRISRAGSKIGRILLIDVDEDGDLNRVAGRTAFDIDGDIDICSKAWNGDEHIYPRNMLKENDSAAGAGSD